jgi:hypothetical protein
MTLTLTPRGIIDGDDFRRFFFDFDRQELLVDPESKDMDVIRDMFLRRLFRTFFPTAETFFPTDEKDEDFFPMLSLLATR